MSEIAAETDRLVVEGLGNAIAVFGFAAIVVVAVLLLVVLWMAMHE